MKASKAISSRTDNPGAPTRNGESSSTIERFALSGPSAELDPLHHAYRGDLADFALASRLFAPHYAKALSRRVGESGVTLHVAADLSSEALAELEPGDAFALLDVTGQWGWGYREADHLVGYLAASALAPL